jgi:hypothetical protein
MQWPNVDVTSGVALVLRRVGSVVGLGMLGFCAGVAQPYWPAEVGTSVQGYQDDFNGTALAAQWQVSGADVYSVGGGLLTVSSTGGDPNHLLCAGTAYARSVQEVLARVRIREFGTGDPCRGGVGLVVDADSSEGINYHFRDLGAGRHLSMLDDLRAWGPDQDVVWQNNTWYWLRLRHEPDAPGQGGVNDVFAKVWLADGSVSEPAAWQLTWDYTPSRSARTGLAGITAGSSAGLSQFEVDYVLIKAAGMPNIVVAPQGFAQGPVAITSSPQSQTVAELASATFTVGVVGDPWPVIHWYRDGAVIPGATNVAYTLDPAAWTDNGARFHVVAINVVSNVTRSATSSVATLTVVADVLPPVLLGARATGLTRVEVDFSEPLEPLAATNVAHYILTGPGGAVAILKAALDVTGSRVALDVNALAASGTYLLTVQDVTDRAAAANRIAAGSRATFRAAGIATVEPPSPCSRRTALVISEIMYRPARVLVAGREARLEFVELCNARDEPEDLSGYRLSGAIDYVFPPSTVIPGGGFAVVAREPADLKSVYGLTDVLGPWAGAATNNLPNGGGTLRLRHRTGAVLLELHYDNESPWPVAAAGTGHSLVLARPSYGEGNPRAWAASDRIGGSPGRWDPTTTDPLDGVLINEYLANTDPPVEDYLELYNASREPKDLSGAWLSDEATTNKYRIPEEHILPPGGFAAFRQNSLGFALNSGGERLFLVNPDQTRVLDAVSFGPQENGVATGRTPDGSPEFSRLIGPTPGTNNTAALASPVVINELMYHPLSGDDDEQYVELHNRTEQPVDLSGWRFTRGIDFTLPANTVLAPGGFLVVARNAARLRTNYAHLTAANCVGDFQGRLSHGGEALELARPCFDVRTNGTRRVTNKLDVVMQTLTFESGGAWPRWADGGGSSLELCDPRSDIRLGANWAASDETGKAPWTLVERRGVVDNLSTTADQLQVLLQGAGECLIDDVEVRGATGANLIANSTFEAGAAGWTAQGTLSASGLKTNGGFNSPRSYHIRAVDRGDNQVNRIRTPLTASLASGTTATLKARARWLCGHPGILLRLRGNGLEAAATLAPPVAPGTPGMRNSRAVANVGPVVFDVAHAPVLPEANQSVCVTARVRDPDGVAALVLHYRVDPNATAVGLPMRDDGLGGDALAGDGEYTATLPGQASGVLVAFSVVATDAAVPAASSRFPADAPARECLVRFGEAMPAGSFPVYRLWMTKATFNAWDGRHNLDNTPNAVTFVLGSQRASYGASALFAGSPYIAPGFSTPSGNRCGYSIAFPRDDRFLGNEDLVLDWPGGHGGETTAIQEQMAYWIADRMGLPFSHRHFIRLYVNGVSDLQRGGVFEAVLQPAGDFLRQWSPDDSNGDFYKIDRAFEFNDSDSVIADPMPRLQPFTTPDLLRGGTMKKTERYRWTWLKRSYDTANDYTNVFALVDALNATAPEPYTTLTEGLVDLEEWMSIFAFEHIINNFDSWGHVIGKNMYAYKPPAGRWQLYAFDLDWLMLVSPRYSSEYTASAGPLFNADDPTVTRMYNHPPFRRAYLRAIQAAVDGPLQSSQCNPVMDAKYASLVAHGITLCDGSSLTAPTALKTWFSQRRTALLSQLAAANAPFSVAGRTNLTLATNLVTLSGTAPIALKTLTIDGVAWPVTWTTVSNWTLRVPVDAGTNRLVIAGRDREGKSLPGVQAELSVVNTGVPPAPQGLVVINEIECAPLIPDAEYVELYNASETFAFDLSGWIFDGIAYTFPAGSFIPPRSFVVLVKDPVAFAIAHGATTPVFDVYPGNLRVLGETLTLVAPGATPAEDLIVDRVRYETAAPWPTPAPGASLQLVDVTQDHTRPANWAISDATHPLAPQWVRVIATGIASSSRLYIYLQSAGDLYVDDLTLVAGSEPEVGVNVVANGNFEASLAGTWTSTANFVQSALSTVVKHAGAASLHVVATQAGSGSGNAIYQDLQPPLSSGETYTLSFWYLQSTNGGPLTIRLSGTGLNATVNPAANLGGVTAATTPGRANAVASALPAFPPLWLNEVQASALGGVTDGAGEREPWIEIHNAGSSRLSLDGLFLSSDLTNARRWAFPAGAVLEPWEFKAIVADGQSEQSTAHEWHTDFRLDPAAGAVALLRLRGELVEVLDHLAYAPVHPGRSDGSFPDGQRVTRFELQSPTPGRPNALPQPALPLLINEWMANNRGWLLDPADLAADDWLELYNPNTLAVELAGYALTDNTNQWNQSVFPAGFQIPAGGYALVWADGHPERNAAGREFHTDFQLSKDGDCIALYSPFGELADLVSFGPQTANISEGRYPDGAALVRTLDVPTPRASNRSGVFDEAPQLTATGQDRQIVLHWSSVPGRSYQVQQSRSLEPAVWEPLITLEATASSQTLPVSTEFSAQSFYRVVLMP